MERYRLTPNDGTKNLMEYTSLGKKPFWSELSRKTGINLSTIRHFINFYNKTDELIPKVGCFKTISEEEKNGFVEAAELNC